LDYLEGEVEDIEVADVEIVGEDITVTFNRDTTPSAVYQAANELVDALKGELEAATLTLNGEENFDLTDDDVALQVALYLLEGTEPEDFLKGKEAVEASYTVEATNENGVEFELNGHLVFQVELVASTYSFSYEVPGEIVAGEEVEVDVTFATEVDY
jgi:hypothetical protein